ncbi:MAG TPA: aldo/keto reductase [Verrucomicrobiae bacterium]|nr:aldo/keto reductase [Verrucomicrobiae bacterium]
MQSIRISNTQLISSRMGYGCWRIAGYEGCECSPERELHGHQAVIAAFEAGFTLFDHADIYSDGMGEIIFGKVLKEIPEFRGRAIIASKCGIRRAGKPDAHAPYRYDFSYEHIVSSCEGSLKRLGVEVIDIYQLHRPDFLANPEEVARAFTTLRQAGKVREFGLSNARPSFFAMLQKHLPMKLIANQVEISLLHIDPFTDGTLDQCLGEGITPMAWSPLGGGRLATSGTIELTDPNHAKRSKIREALDLIAREKHATRAAIALAFLLTHPANIIPIVGTTNQQTIAETVKACDITLSREEWYRLFEAAWGHRLP